MALQETATKANAPFARALAAIVLSFAIALSLNACTAANSSAVSSGGSTNGETIATDEGFSPVNVTANIQERATMTDDLTLAYWYLEDALGIDINSLECLRCYPGGSNNTSTLVQYKVPGQDFKYMYSTALAWGCGNIIGRGSDSFADGISGTFDATPLEGYDDVYRGVIGAEKSWAINRDIYMICDSNGLFRRTITSNGDGSYVVQDYSYDDENRLTQIGVVPSFYGLDSALDGAPIELGKTYDSMMNLVYGSDGSLESIQSLNDFAVDKNGLPEMEYKFTHNSNGNIQTVERYSYTGSAAPSQREPQLYTRLEYTHDDNGLISEIGGYKYSNGVVREATSFTFAYDDKNADDGYVREYLSPITI